MPWRSIMGHAPTANDMSAVYNEEAVEDSRLLAVANYVHDWLFSKKPAGSANGEPASEEAEQLTASQ